MFSVGDYVVRLSYKKDIMFRINYISPNQVARLKGVSYRIVADAPVADLELVEGMRYTSQEDNVMSSIDKSMKEIMAKRQEEKKGKNPTFQKTGTVLHVDGDAYYLNLCLKYYKLLDIPAIGEHVAEAEQPKRIRYLLEKYSPDILVLTGHDSLNKTCKNIYDINEYRNSNYFIDSVKRARAIKPSSSDLIIFAGACQSYFEEILAAGADFAASPSRVLIHALDPVFVVERIAQCAFYQVLPIEEAIQYTITKFKGVGGYEVLGKCRRGGPVMSVEEEKEKEEEDTFVEDKIRNTEPEFTEDEIEEELAKPLFKDSTSEFENKMQAYINKCRIISNKK